MSKVIIGKGVDRKVLDIPEATPAGASQEDVDAALAAHVAAVDPHAGYQRESEKGQGDGYASLDGNAWVPPEQLGDNTPTGKTVLLGDQTWAHRTQYNQSTAAQGAVTSGNGLAADTYVAGSNISAIPSGALKVGSRYHLVANLVKGGFGTAGLVVNVRLGTLGTTGDTARATLTFTAQTAVADEGTLELWVTFRAVGATAVIQAVGQLRHRLTTTGLTNAGAVATQIATSAAFDVTGVTVMGISLNAGANGAVQMQLVQARLENLS